jgi:hypothetical protein
MYTKLADILKNIADIDNKMHFMFGPESSKRGDPGIQKRQ